jgi:hypothetical protein
MSQTPTTLPAPEDIVPVKPRHDGWTAARQQEFLHMLADTGSVAQAARRVGMSRQAAYRLRRHPAATDFRTAWDLAVDEAFRQLPATALERALNGDEEQVERDGVVVAVRRRPCDPRLMIHLLKMEEERRVSRRQLEQEYEQLRSLIDVMPDRRNWLGDRLDPVHFHEIERLPPSLRVISPDDSQIGIKNRHKRLLHRED